MEQVWGMDFCGESRTVDMHIRTLRQKLGAYGEHIETVRGVGYRLEAQREQCHDKNVFSGPSLLVGVVVLLAALALVMGVLYSYFGTRAGVAAAGRTEPGRRGRGRRAVRTTCANWSPDQYRITWVAADGAVLYDTQADAAAMENHAQTAGDAAGAGLRRGREQPVHPPRCCRRPCTTPSAWTDGTVLRLSVRRVTAAVLTAGYAAAASAAGHRGADPVRRAGRTAGQANRRASQRAWIWSTLWRTIPMRSWRPCCGGIEHQRRQIDRQMDELQQQAEEFQQITGSMNEGLVLLDEQRRHPQHQPGGPAPAGHRQRLRRVRIS